MAFSDMNDVEQELGDELPPNGNGNRTFLIIAGTLGGIMVLALLCIAGLALFRYLPGQRAAQELASTQAAQDTAVALSAQQTASVPTATATRQPTFTPTNTQAPTNTPVIVIVPTKSPTLDIAVVTRDALLTQTAIHSFVTVTPGATQPETTQPVSSPRPTSTALPGTGIADELGIPGLISVAFVLIVVMFLVRKLRTAT
jgi:type II secretory pathway pseudopilin PulG